MLVLIPIMERKISPGSSISPNPDFHITNLVKQTRHSHLRTPKPCCPRPSRCVLIGRPAPFYRSSLPADTSSRHRPKQTTDLLPSISVRASATRSPRRHSDLNTPRPPVYRAHASCSSRTRSTAFSHSIPRRAHTRSAIGDDVSRAIRAIPTFPILASGQTSPWITYGLVAPSGTFPLSSEAKPRALHPAPNLPAPVTDVRLPSAATPSSPSPRTTHPTEREMARAAARPSTNDPVATSRRPAPTPRPRPAAAP